MDHVSNLPDEVLSHILSFLTTKQAALTLVLSKRWRNLFAFVPNLDIDDSVFLHPEEGKRERGEIIQSFIDFVDRVLALQGGSLIKKFSLKVKTGVDEDYEDHVDHWICNVLQRGVLDLDLFIDDGDLYYLPYKILFSTTLINLKLRSLCGVPSLSGAEGSLLPMLKTLVIEQARIRIGWDNIEMFLPDFPVLEELDLDNLEWDSDSDHTVSSASLRKLTIYANGFDVFSNPKSISFDTPSLAYLEYSDFVAMDYPILNLTNLVEALFNLMVSEDQIELIRAPNDEDDVILPLRNVWKLFYGIRNVQKLFFSAVTLEVLSLCCESMPVFNNLKLLRIKSVEDRGWQAMPVLLRNCPHLETLVLEGLLHYVTDKCGDVCDCISREDKGRSLISCRVKNLQIKGFRGTNREIGMIKHFLDYFPCLEEMKIYVEEKDPTEFEVPGRFELVTEMMNLYDELLSCDINLLVSTPLYEKWTAQ